VFTHLKGRSEEPRKIVSEFRTDVCFFFVFPETNRFSVDVNISAFPIGDFGLNWDLIPFFLPPVWSPFFGRWHRAYSAPGVASS